MTSGIEWIQVREGRDEEREGGEVERKMPGPPYLVG